MPSENSPISDISEGAARGILKFTAEQVHSLVEKLQAGELAFIEDTDTIEIVKTERQRPEWQFVKNYISSKELRLQLLAGFALKRLEKSPEKLQKLRDKLHNKYGARGLHIAQLSQNGIFSKYIGLLLGKTSDVKQLEEGIQQILSDIEKYVFFVKAEQDVDKSAREIIVRIQANVPKAFIVFSSGLAMEKGQQIVAKVVQEINGYVVEAQIDDSQRKLYYFLLKTS